MVFKELSYHIAFDILDKYGRQARVGSILEKGNLRQGSTESKC